MKKLSESRKRNPGSEENKREALSIFATLIAEGRVKAPSVGVGYAAPVDERESTAGTTGRRINPT
jgi:hypothetical protein